MAHSSRRCSRTFAFTTSDADAVARQFPRRGGLRGRCRARLGASRTSDCWLTAPIRTGRSNDGLVEVLEGLKPGERVVTRGGLFIDQAAAPG